MKPIRTVAARAAHRLMILSMREPQPPHPEPASDAATLRTALNRAEEAYASILRQLR